VSATVEAGGATERTCSESAGSVLGAIRVVIAEIRVATGEIGAISA
jgi:hypothetical protein